MFASRCSLARPLGRPVGAKTQLLISEWREREATRWAWEEGASLNNSCGVRSGRERGREGEEGGHDYSPVRRDLGASAAVADVARAAGGLFVAAAPAPGEGRKEGDGGGEKTRVRVSSIMMSSLLLLSLFSSPPFESQANHLLVCTMTH